MPINLRLLLIANSLFEGGRLSVGAVGVLFLLGNGLSLSDCASLKLVQVATFLVCDIPLGLLLNRIGSLKSMKLASILAITGCLGYLFSHSFVGFIVAEFLTALSISIWPAASSTYAMDVLDAEDYAKNSFFHKTSSSASLSTLLFGVIGGLVYIVQIRLPYCLLLFAMVTCLLVIFTLKSDVEAIAVVNKGNFQIKDIRKYFRLWPIVSILVAIQFFSQMQLHYWQPLLKDLNLNGSQWIFSAAFGFITLIMAFSSYIYSMICEKETMKNTQINLVLLSVLGITASALYFAHSYVLAFLLVGILYSVSKIATTSVTVQIQERVDSNERLAIIKTVSWTARLGMVTSLSVISVLLEIVSVKDLFVLFGLVMIAFSVIYLLAVNLDKIDSKSVARAVK